jgi:hypothetical protein
MGNALRARSPLVLQLRFHEWQIGAAFSMVNAFSSAW